MQVNTILKVRPTFGDYGLDTEAIAYDVARNVLWVSDEYGSIHRQS